MDPGRHSAGGHSPAPGTPSQPTGLASLSPPPRHRLSRLLRAEPSLQGQGLPRTTLSALGQREQGCVRYTWSMIFSLTWEMVSQSRTFTGTPWASPAPCPTASSAFKVCARHVGAVRAHAHAGRPRCQGQGQGQPVRRPPPLTLRHHTATHSCLFTCLPPHGQRCPPPRAQCASVCWVNGRKKMGEHQSLCTRIPRLLGSASQAKEPKKT